MSYTSLEGLLLTQSGLSTFSFGESVCLGKQLKAEAATIRSLPAEQNHWEYWACSRQTYSKGFRGFIDSLADIPSCPDNYAIGALSKPYIIADGELLLDDSKEGLVRAERPLVADRRHSRNSF